MKTPLLEQLNHPLSTEERIRRLDAAFKTPGVTAEKSPIIAYDFRWGIFFFLLSALICSFLGLWNPGTVWIGIIIAIMAIREFYRPLGSRFKGSPAENLYYTIPARSKEVQKLYIIATYGTDDLLIKPQAFLANQILTAHQLAFISYGLISITASLTGNKPLWFIALIPLLAWAGWSLTFPARNDRDAFFNCTVLADLKNLLTKSTPVSTSVTFAFLGSRSLHSGAYHLLPVLKNTSKMTYIVNLTDYSDGNRPLIITSEGSLFPQESDPTLIELLHIVAAEKGIAVGKSKIGDYTEIFPFLLSGLKAVSVAVPRDAGSEYHRDIRELLAGLIRKIEH